MAFRDVLRLKSSEVGRILRVVEAVFACATRIFKDEEDWPGRNGAAFCLLDAVLEVALLRVEVGSLNTVKAEKYYALALEKAQRLAKNRNDIETCWSSFQTRNPDNGQWGGAIPADGHSNFSLSGLPELGDEAVCLVAAVLHGTLGQITARMIASLSENPYFERLLAEMKLLLQDDATRLVMMGSLDSIAA